MIVASNANDRRSRNLYQKLVPVSVTYDMQSCINFSGIIFWYQIEHVLFGTRNWYQFLVQVS